MQLINSSKEFTFKGASLPDMPILIDGDCEIVKPVFRFTVYLTIQDARIQSPRTINNYTSALYDYFSFIEANQLTWDEPYLNDAENFTISVLALYRNWSRTLKDKSGVRSVSDSTINLRLSVLKRFYEYCYSAGIINFEPWETLFKVQLETMPGFLRHTRGQKIVKGNDLTLRTFKKPPKLLSLSQCKELLSAIDSATFKLTTKLLLSTGIRKDELVSFVVANISEPDLRKLNKRIPIDLVPVEGGQRTKGCKPRRIFVSVPLMKELWDYLHFGERVVRGRKHEEKYGSESQFLFLNRFGSPYGETALNNTYDRLSEGKSPKINFKVSPHMLRHTYATIELFAESQRVGTTKALAWVQKRLGHSSLSTTSVYLHCIELLQEHELSTYQAELDAME